MGIYSKLIFPRICDFFLNNPIVSEQRRHLLANATGDALEIGFGTGLNLPHYPERIFKLTAIDPNEGMRKLAIKRIQQSKMEVDQKAVSGEHLPFENETFDTVVSTFTLCSIPDVNQALKEIHRVIRPGGQFLFLEHGLSPDPSIQKWQHRFNPLEKWLADGCNLNRNMKELVARQEFSEMETNEFYLEKSPKMLGYIYRGIATK